MVNTGTFDHTWPFLLSEVVQAHDLADLQRRCDAAFATLLPGSRYDLIWDDASLPYLLLGAGPIEPLPRADELSRLGLGESIAPDGERPGFLPLRMQGRLCGWIKVIAATWSAEQQQTLTTLATLLGPIVTGLAKPIPHIVTRAAQHSRILAEVQQLRGVLQLDILLEQMFRITSDLLEISNFLLALRNEGSDWLELMYLVFAGQRYHARQFWRPGTGLTGVVFSSRQPVRTDDYAIECRRYGLLPLLVDPNRPVYAWMGVPVYVQDDVIGVLVIFETEPGRIYNEDQADLFQELATETAIAIQNARLYARTERQAQQMAALNRISHSITSTLDPERVPSLIMQQTQELLNVEEGSLLLRDEQSGDLIFSYACGSAGNQLLGQRLPQGIGVAGYVASTGQVAIVNDTSTDGRFSPATDSQIGFVTRSLLAVPMGRIGGIMGVIEVVNKRNGAPFIEEDRLLLEAVADQAVIALENARRFSQIDQALAQRARELDRSNAQLRDILRVGNALRAEWQLDALLGQIADAACQSTGFRSAVIALVEYDRRVQPYLRRVVAAGSAANAIERLRQVRVPVERLQELLRPEFQRGAATYFIDHQHDDYIRFWGNLDQHYIPDLPPPEPGGWHARDTLFSLLHNRHGELLGVLRVEEPEDGRQPTPEQVQILEIFANQAAVAIENARLYNEQQHNLRSMIALNGLGMAINTTLRSPAQIMELTTSGLVETTRAYCAMVLLYEDDATLTGSIRETASLRTVFHLGPSADDSTLLFNLAHLAISNGRPVKHQQDATETIFWVAIPLRATRQALGAICVGFRDGFPDTADLETLALFGGQAAVAVENLRLFEALRQGRDQLASIMASTYEGMLLIADTGQIVVVNGAFQRLVGLADQFPSAGLALEAFLDRWQAGSKYTTTEWQMLRAAFQEVSAGTVEARKGELSQPDASTPALEWTLLRVRGENPFDGVETQMIPLADPVTHSLTSLLLVLRDITDAKEAERLRQDMTNMVVHDLRSPLSSIMASLDMISKGITGEVTPGQSSVLGIAYASAEHLLSLINMMLDISRLESRRMPLEYEILAVDTLVQRAVERLEPIARSKHIRINVAMADTSVRIYADRELMLRVLQNLLDNAIKFSPNESSVTISVSAPEGVPDDTDEITNVKTSEGMTISLYPTRLVTCSVRDAGQGISAIDQEKIFARFGQAGKRRRKGTGLGLTFCKLVVEAHGGRIWVESEVGAGSLFAFSLPSAALEAVPDV